MLATVKAATTNSTPPLAWTKDFGCEEPEAVTKSGEVPAVIKSGEGAAVIKPGEPRLLLPLRVDIYLDHDNIGAKHMPFDRDHYCHQICPMFSGQLWGCEENCDYTSTSASWEPKPHLYRRTISHHVKRNPGEDFHSYPIGLARPGPFNPFP